MLHSREILTKLKNFIFLTKDVDKMASIFSEGLGLQVLKQSASLVELRDNQDQRFILKKVNSEAFCTYGFSPIFTFQILDMQKTLDRMKGYGCTLEGEIQTDERKKLGCLKIPDGPMIGLLETKGDESDTDEDMPTGGGGAQEEDKTTTEIRNILRKIKI